MAWGACHPGATVNGASVLNGQPFAFAYGQCFGHFRNRCTRTPTKRASESCLMSKSRFAYFRTPRTGMDETGRYRPPAGPCGGEESYAGGSARNDSEVFVLADSLRELTSAADEETTPRELPAASRDRLQPAQAIKAAMRRGRFLFSTTGYVASAERACRSAGSPAATEFC
jgi:hypothetical protein